MINMKTCRKCYTDQELSLFSKCVANKDGLQTVCKPCRSIENKEWRTVNKEYQKERAQLWRDNNPDYSKNHYYDNLLVYQNYKESNKTKRNVSEAKKRKEDIEFRLSAYLRNRLNAAIKDDIKAGSAVKNLGCSLIEFKQYLASKFEPGMTWGNHSMFGWHIDHIMPLDSFDLTKLDEIKKACHYTNLQPLWAKQNITKSNKVG